MDLRTTVDDGTGTVFVAGELDIATADLLDGVLTGALKRTGATELVVDLGEVPFIDSSGVRALVHASVMAAERGLRVRVARPGPFVRRVLRVTGVAGMLGLPEEEPAGPDDPPRYGRRLS